MAYTLSHFVEDTDTLLAAWSSLIEMSEDLAARAKEKQDPSTQLLANNMKVFSTQGHQAAAHLRSTVLSSYKIKP